MEIFHFDLLSGSWLAVGGAAILAALVGYIGYRRTMPQVSHLMRWTLTILRSTAIFVLLIVLFEPVLRFVLSSEERPKVVVLIDDSRSNGMHDVGRKRDEDTRSLAAIVANHLGDRAQIATFHGAVREVDVAWTPDSLTFAGLRTDLTSAIRWGGNRSVVDGASAIVMLTDGNHNTGDGPVYEASRAGVPIYVVGIGDTTPPKDISVVSMIAPPFAVVGTPSRISATVTSDGFQGRSVRIELLENNLVIASATLDELSRRDRRTIDMEWLPKAEGLQSIAIRAVPLDGEFTTANNRIAEGVMVRSNKRRLAVIAGAPSADVSFVVQALRARSEYEVTSFVMRPGGGFYEGNPTLAVLTEAEAIITIGFPSQGCPASVVDMVQTAVVKKGRSLLWIGGPSVDMTLLRGIDDALPFMVLSSRQREVQVTLHPREGAESDPVLRLRGDADDGKRWADVAPIYRPEMFVRPVDGARTVATMRVNNVAMDEPLMVVKEGTNFRSLALIGHGIYRWKLLSKGMADGRGETSAVDVLTEWLGNCVQWLAVKPEERRVRIRPLRQQYAAGEQVELSASVRDEADREVSDALVSVRYISAAGQKQTTMIPLGGGRYTANLGAIPPGTYTFDGEAQKGGTLLGRDSGRWTVGDVDVESRATTIDTLTISMIASRSRGAWRMSDKARELLSLLDNDARLAPSAVTRTTETALWAHPLLLMLAILLLSAEWFLRKRSALV